MTRTEDQGLTVGRRELLQMSLAAAASAALGKTSRAARGEDPAAGAQPAGTLPTIALGPHRITRLVAGWNPIGGHSHTTLNMARHMREYFTVEQTAEFLEQCEDAGIGAWQYDHTEKAVEAVRIAREKGSKLKLICLHAERRLDASIKEVVDACQPIAIVHHGGVTDALFRAGKQQQIRDFIKKVHDAGALAGVSAHNPDNIRYIADAGWENDLFMTCFYYVTRPREEQQTQLGKVTVGEPFFASDPVDMTNVIKTVEKPCLGFKILAAGRLCWSKHSVERAFRFAFENIKPTDGVIVGMYPRYHDEVHDDARYVAKYGVTG